MFTGLVEEVGTVVSTRGSADYRLISIRGPKVAATLRPGDSLSVNGACQTVVRVEGGVASVEALSETLAKTNLGSLASGSVVNLERPLTPQSRFDGHIVQGHVDGQGAVIETRRLGEGYYLSVRLPEQLARSCIAQGSIAIDGISLTIAGLSDNTVTINVIPTTWRDTTLRARKVGERVNVEADVIGRYVFRYLETAGAGAGLGGSGGGGASAGGRGGAGSPAPGSPGPPGATGTATGRSGPSAGTNTPPGPRGLTAERLAELGYSGGSR